MATSEILTPAVGPARVPARPATAYLALAAGVLCISFTAILTKWAGVPGPAAAALRMTAATAVLTVPFAWHVRRSGLPHVGVRWGVMGGLWFAINLGLLSSALLLTSAANATLMDNTAPIWVGLGALIFFREKLRKRYWVGLGLALTGAAVVSGFRLAGDLRLNAGDALAFVGAVFYAGYLLNTQRARRDLDALTYLWLVAATAAVALVAFCLIRGLPLLGYSPRARFIVQGHLRAGVDGQLGEKFAAHQKHAGVLNKDGIGAHLMQGFKGGSDCFKLALFAERIDGDIDFSAAQMGETDGGAKRFLVKARACARAK